MKILKYFVENKINICNYSACNVHLCKYNAIANALINLKLDNIIF